MSSSFSESSASSVVAPPSSSSGGTPSPPVGVISDSLTPLSDQAPTVFIDDTDVTSCAIHGAWTPRLNRPAQFTVTLPMDCAVGDAGSRIRFYIDGSLLFHGFCLNTETDTDVNQGTTVYNAQD